MPASSRGSGGHPRETRVPARRFAANEETRVVSSRPTSTPAADPSRPDAPDPRPLTGSRRDVTVAARHVSLIRPGATEAQSDDTYEVDDCFGSDLGTAEAYKRILHPR